MFDVALALLGEATMVEAELALLDKLLFEAELALLDDANLASEINIKGICCVLIMFLSCGKVEQKTLNVFSSHGWKNFKYPTDKMNVCRYY